ncbi:MAG: hypothetical protein HWN68_04780 [Desulfobacterales bacterium]|nr:hypothetical protein [Desulfobacterales bacterium]
MKTDNIQLARLVNMEDPQSVLDEVKIIAFMIFPKLDFEPVNRVFADVVRLFQGKYPGYRQCNTEYHDLQHTTDAMLALTRLIHGATLQGETFSEKNVALGVISALLHDTGYIQTLDDDSGTGAKYTLIHIERSIEFMDKYFRQIDFSVEDFENCRDILNCTGLNTNISEIRFKSREIELLGKMLGTADLLGQMADRTYLEKLPFLFNEFMEGNVVGCISERELLKETLGFYDITKKRFAGELGNVKKYMIHHFKKRWNIDRELYQDAIDKNINYLKYILADHEEEHRNHLRRNGVMKRLDEEGM